MHHTRSVRVYASRQRQEADLRKPSGTGPIFCCRLSGISRKWLCLLRITRSRSRKLPEQAGQL